MLRKPLAGEKAKLESNKKRNLRFLLCCCLFTAALTFAGGERSGSTGSLGSVRSSSSLQSSGNTHVLTTPAPSPHPAPTTGLNTHGLNAPGLHAQSEGVKVRHHVTATPSVNKKIISGKRQNIYRKETLQSSPQDCFLFSLFFRWRDQHHLFFHQQTRCAKIMALYTATSLSLSAFIRSKTESEIEHICGLFSQ